MNKDEVLQLGNELLSKHNLPDWKFKTDKAIVRFGVTFFKEKVISVSLPLCEINSREEIIDTILHEIAHAIAGYKDGFHGATWKKVARKIGARPDRLYKQSDVQTVPFKYEAVCPVCNKKYYKYYKYTNRHQSCGNCSDHYDERFKLIYKKLI